MGAELGLGTVPAWASAGSLVLAFVIFGRDRRERRRKQIDELGAWSITDPSIDVDIDSLASKPNLLIKNASNLPIRVLSVEYLIYRGLGVVNAGPPESARLIGKVVLHDHVIPPSETVTLVDGVNCAMRVKDRGHFMDFHGTLAKNAHVTRVTRVYAIDNAGRRWVVRPSRGGFPRRDRQLGFLLGLLISLKENDPRHSDLS
ncbi:hypothetical protein [Amycolatopsis sp. NPDC051371]|uniref:hypothetical protein n=1 Tax=Amycolatopsis sp. NPDC051371 TaxID=3155800 RepID=UPI00341DD4E7